MATPKIVPRAAGEGALGDAAYGWGGGFITNTTTTSATQGGKLVLAANDSVAAMGDDHRLGVIEFKGEEDANDTLSIGARIEAICRDAWDGSNNDADLQFFTTNGTTESLVLTLDADKKAWFGDDINSVGNIIVGADADGTDRSITFGHSTLKSIMGIDDSGDRFVINTDAAFEAANSLEIDANNNLYTHGRTLTFGDGGGGGLTFSATDTAHDTVGAGLVVRAGNTTAGTTNNIAGGALYIQGGRGKGSGAGGDIIFQTANAGGSGSSLNALATALTISDDLSATFAGTVVASSGAITGINYRTIYVDAGSMVPAETNGAQATTEEMHATNFATIDYMAFDKATEEYVDFKVVMPEQYNNGTVKVKFYWKPSDAEASVSVIWGIKAYAATDSDLLKPGSGVWGTAVEIEDESLNTDDDLHISAATAAMTIAGTPAEGKLVFFRVYRKAADGTDDYDADAHLLGVNIQYVESSTASAAW
jgi:hypothetical protein